MRTDVLLGRDERSSARPWAVRKVKNLTLFPSARTLVCSIYGVGTSPPSLPHERPLRKAHLKLTSSRHSLARALPVIGAVGGAAWYMTRLARGTEGASALSLLPFPPHSCVGRADDPPFPLPPLARPSNLPFKRTQTPRSISLLPQLSPKLFTPAVVWDKKNNPHPWQHVKENQQVKLFAVNHKYDGEPWKRDRL